MKYLIVLMLMLFSAGCTATYETLDVKKMTSMLNKDEGVTISVPKDGWYDDEIYSNSGEMTSKSLKSAFLKYTNNVFITNSCHGEECISLIDSAKYKYYVWPEILHWEERATEWTGLPDRIEVKVSIYDIKTKEELSSVSLKGKSKWATFGGDHAQDLLEEPIEKHVFGLYNDSASQN